MVRKCLNFVQCCMSGRQENILHGCENSACMTRTERLSDEVISNTNYKGKFMIHAQVTIAPIGGEFAQPNRVSRTFEVCGIDRIECEQRALDQFGDYCQVQKFSQFDPDYPPQYPHLEEEDI